MNGKRLPAVGRLGLAVLIVLTGITGHAFAGGPAGGVLPVSKLPDARDVRAATVLSDGRVLVLGDPSDKPMIWDPKPAAWRTLPPPPVCHSGPYTVTRLPDERLLIAGSARAGNICTKNKLAIWNASDESWMESVALHEARGQHTATLLADGGVLFVGGRATDFNAPDRPLSSVELYHDGTISAMPPLRVARGDHSATRLRDGRVLVAGGAGGENKSLSSVEIWDPVKRVWATGKPMRNARRGHAAALLPDGRVIVMGGINAGDQAIAAVEIWDPKTGNWSSAPPLWFPVARSVSAVLADGDVLLIASALRNDIRDPKAKEPFVLGLTSPPILRWRPSDQRWHLAGTLDRDWTNVAIAPLPDGAALLFERDRVLRWSPAPRPDSALPIFGGREAVEARLRDGRVLIIGGQDYAFSAGNDYPLTDEPPPEERPSFSRMGRGSLFRPPVDQTPRQRYVLPTFLDAVEIFDPATQRFSLSGRLSLARAYHSTLVLKDDRVLVTGGIAVGVDRPDRLVDAPSEVWSPQTGTWQALSDELRFSAQHAVHVGQLDDGRVLFFVTREHGAPEFRVWIWDPARHSVQRREVSVQARAGTSALVMPDGRVLLVDAGARRAELWHNATDTTRALAPPPVEGAGWEMLWLRRKQVLLVEAYADEWTMLQKSAKSSRAMLWDPVSGQWAKIDDLPGVYLRGSALLELEDGTVFVQSSAGDMQLPAASAAWLPFEPPAFGVLRRPMTASLALPSPGIGVSSFAHLDRQKKSWRLGPASYVPRARPALVELADGQLLVAGGGGMQRAERWNPSNGAWSEAAALTRGISDPQAVRLPSHVVLLVGRMTADRLACESWDPAQDVWTDCGSFDSQQRNFALGQLTDGRALLLFGQDEWLIFDEAQRAWRPAQIHIGSPTAASTTVSSPTSFGPTTQVWNAPRQTWEDVTAWRVQRQPDLSALRLRDGGILTSRLDVWDPVKGSGTNVRLASDQFGFGKQMSLLSDGCALSWPPFALFSPDGARYRVVPGPELGVQDTSMAALRDGTVVFAGRPQATHDFAQPGFARVRASCRGLKAFSGEQPAMPGASKAMPEFDLGMTPPAAVSAPAASPAAETAWSRWWAGIYEYRWVFYILAMLAMGIYLVHRFRRSQWMSTQIRLPTTATLITRTLGYGLALLFLLPILYAYGNFRTAQHARECLEQLDTRTQAKESALTRTQGLIACIDERAGWLERLAYRRAKADVQALPYVPCRYVGIWSAKRPQSEYRVTLKDNGEFLAEPISDPHGAAELVSGSWGFHDDHLIWLYDSGHVWPPDTNPIKPLANDRFELIEANGTRTEYRLIQDLASNSCIR